MEDEPFHSRLVEAMDGAIDLFDRGPMRHSVPLQVLQLVRCGAELTGTVAYDDALRRSMPAAPEALPLARLYASQPHNEATIIVKLRKADRQDVEALWAVAGKEAAQGFAPLHLRRRLRGRCPMCSTTGSWWSKSSGTLKGGRTNGVRAMMAQHVG